LEYCVTDVKPVSSVEFWPYTCYI